MLARCRMFERHPKAVAISAHGGSVRRIFEAAQLAERPVLENCEIVAFRAEGTVLELLDG